MTQQVRFIVSRSKAEWVRIVVQRHWLEQVQFSVRRVWYFWREFTVTGEHASLVAIRKELEGYARMPLVPSRY